MKLRTLSIFLSVSLHLVSAGESLGPYDGPWGTIGKLCASYDNPTFDETKFTDWDALPPSCGFDIRTGDSWCGRLGRRTLTIREEDATATNTHFAYEGYIWTVNPLLDGTAGFEMIPKEPSLNSTEFRVFYSEEHELLISRLHPSFPPEGGKDYCEFTVFARERLISNLGLPNKTEHL